MLISRDLFAFVVVPSLALLIALGGFGIVVLLTRGGSERDQNPNLARLPMWEGPRAQPSNRHAAE